MMSFKLSFILIKMERIWDTQNQFSWLRKNSPSYSENISVKENSDLYTVTKSDNSELENICWLIVKDGEIQKIVDASEINEFKLRKDVPEGVYTVLLCTDYDSTTHSYTQVSNAIEIII